MHGAKIEVKEERMDHKSLESEEQEGPKQFWQM